MDEGNGPWFYRLQPYSTDYPRGTLSVIRRDGRTAEGRIAYDCAIAWTEDAETLRPRIVFSEVVSSGVGDDLDPDSIAATALGFASYTERGAEYGCEPADAWQEWVEVHGEQTGCLRYDDDSGSGESLAHLRNYLVS